YRLLGMLGTRDRTEGMAFGGRVAGKINLNTMPPPVIIPNGNNPPIYYSVFNALADAQTGNYFDSNQVNTVLNALLQQRTANPNGIPGPGDRPFYSMITTPLAGDAQYGPQSGNNAEVMRDGNNPGTELIDSPQGGTNQTPQHPYVQHELLRKIYGNLTTRSNTFAVFITTGFFDVRGQRPGGGPPLLGGEVNPELRHRFFAIVDRTNLAMGDPARQIYDPNFQTDGTIVDGRKQANRPIYVPFEPVQVQGNNLIPQNSAPAGSAQLTATVYGEVINGSLTLKDQFAQNGSPETFIITQNQTILYLDVGNGQERLLVTGIAGSPQFNLQNPQYVLQLTPLGPAPNYAPGKTQFNHVRGVALATQIAGNPGPQNYPLPYWQAPYSNTVIGYQQIMK
ncbi:MAG TPA: hypothetical protein VGZ47_06260, partial [Gemmataceae bacterium]|nr:hypothetical protein [Gemmataceae bacterium]